MQPLCEHLSSALPLSLGWQHWIRDHQCMQMCKANQPDVLIVATKPQYVEQALADVAMVALQGKGLSKTLVVSIAAGKSVEALIKALNNNDVRNLRGARVCRVMPNTPCMVGEAASALCRGV